MQLLNKAVVLASLLAVATAYQSHHTTSTSTSPASAPTQGQCNTGSVQCCNSVQSATSPTASGLLSLLGVVLEDVDTLVGITCSPVTAILGGESGCNASPVCCTGNSFNGIIVIGCSPINIHL